MKNTIYFNAEFAPLLLVNEEQVGSNSIVINIEADSTANQSLLITMDSGTTTSLTVTPGQENSLAIDEAYWSLGGSTFVSLVKGGLTSNSITLIFPETINTDAALEETSNLTYTMTGSNTVTEQIDNLDDRVTTLEQGGGGNKIYISELAPTVEDNAIGNEGDLWYKVKRKGHFEGAVLKCVRAGIMTHPNMEFSVGQYVRINYGNYYNNNDPYLKGWGPTSWEGYLNFEYIAANNMQGINSHLSTWGNFPGYYPRLYGNQSLRIWTCNYDEERMITRNEVAVGGFDRTAVGYEIGYQGNNYGGWSTLSIGGILFNIEYSESNNEHMVNPATVQAAFNNLALFEIVDWGEGTNFNYDGTIIERMVLERYIKYDGVWVTADYKAGKGIIIGDGEIRVDVSTSVDIIQNVTSGTQLATINGTSIYAPTVSATQTQTSGTEIGTVTVGDTSTTLYAPTPQSVSATQTLSSGTEIGSITIDNSTTTLYAPTGGGSDVIVTPKTSTGTNIADIEVDGTTYNLFAPTSGGGGGGSGSGYTETSLWSGSQTTTGTLTLSDSIQNYDIIALRWSPHHLSTNYYQRTDMILVSSVMLGSAYQYLISEMIVGGEYSSFASCHFEDYTHFTLDEVTSGNVFTFTFLEVIGLKFSTTETAFIYSNEERVVGVWIDNRPLYQKTLNLTSPSGPFEAAVIADLTSLNIENLVKVEGFLYSATYSQTLPIYWSYAVSSGFSNSNWGTVYYENTYLKQNLSSPAYTQCPVTITIQYTKSTDTPGSAPYVTSGSYAHHYSTAEQVVGTWIDGSTLYEKTQYGGITFSTRGTWYDTDITNIDKVVSVEGSIFKDGDPIGIGYWASSIVSKWVLRNHTLKISMEAMVSSETYTLNSITVRYTKTS